MTGTLGLSTAFVLTKEQIEEATNAGISRDPLKIANLSVDQILWLDSQILTSGGLGDLMFGTQTWGDKVILSENNTSGNKNTSNPNKGKELTKEEKEALGMSSGGSTTGTPNGFEPDNENKPNSSQNTNQNNNSGQLNQTYTSIKDAPQYPQGFRATQNGTTKHTINNRELLNELRKVESGKWQKVYKNGFDASGNRVSVHYFQSQSGRVFNVKVKPNWS